SGTGWAPTSTSNGQAFIDARSARIPACSPNVPLAFVRLVQARQNHPWRTKKDGQTFQNVARLESRVELVLGHTWGAALGSFGFKGRHRFDHVRSGSASV